MHCLSADICSPLFSPVFSSTLSQPKMHWPQVITSEAALWFVILFLSLEEVPGRPSSPKLHDKNVPQSQMAWCEETKACAKCVESKSPKCLRHGEPLLGGDLCGCCFSCVVIRGLGESCGSQLSVWPDILETSSVSASITILATSWCREGLVCVNFICLDSNANVEPVTFPRLKTDEGFVESKNDHIVSDVFGQDMTTPFDSEAGLPAADFYQRTTTPLWKPILVNHDDPNLPKIVSSTPITPIPSSASPLTESRKQPEPCYAESEETMTISSYPSDDQLGRVATTTLDGRRFQLVYTGDLLSELKVLLNVIDEFRQDTLLDEGVVNSLANGFLGSLSLLDNDGLLLDDQESVKVLPITISDARETTTSSSLHNLMFSEPREKRELERIEEDVVGFEAPKNIEDILIRSASAHREYVDMARGYEQQTNISNKNANVMPVEASSQEDESSVRVHITNHPRKMQTLIDLEEKEKDEVIDDQDRRNLQLVNMGYAKDTGKLFPLSNERSEASPSLQRPLGPTGMAEQNGMTEKTGRSKPTDISQVINGPWQEALVTFSDRLTLVEVRMGIFERVLEELAKWCNLGVLSMTRDCLVPQSSDIRDDRWSPETDEHLAVASGIDAVRIRENRRKLGGNMPRRDGYHDTRTPDTAKRPGIFSARQIALRGRNGHVNPSFFRTIIDKDSLRHPSVSGHRRPGRPAKSPCGNSGHRGSSWRQSIADAIDDSPVHRTVQRSVLMTNPSSNISSELNKCTNVDQTIPQDTQPLLTLQESQIPVSTTLAKKVMILRDLEKPESSPLEDIFPQGWVSTVKITSSSGIPSLKMFVSDEKKKENGEEWQSYPRMKSGLGKLGLQRNAARTKRSVKQVEGISPTHDTLAKIRAEFPVATRRTGKLFELETTVKTGLELDTSITRNMWPGGIIRENDSHGALFMTGISEFRNSPEPMMRQLLLRNSDLLQTTESTLTGISSNLQNTRKVLDPHVVPYSITNYGNSTIRIEKISEPEFEDRPPHIRNSSIVEDDFDHIYESVEGEAEDGDFEYDIAYDGFEYVDSSSVETVTDFPPQLQKPETELKSVLALSKTEIHSILFPRERNRRGPRSEDDQFESARHTKREMPLLLFGSTGKHEPKTIVWPSKWIGYRRDRLLGVGGSGIDRTGLNSRSWETRSPAILTTPSLPLRTTQSLITVHRLRNGETNYIIAPKISSLDHRAKKNRRKLIWR